MQEKDLLHEVLEHLAGPPAIAIIETLLNQEEITDEKIASIIEIPLKKVRRTLYRLHEIHLCQYRRTRDSQTNYYVYYWQLSRFRLQNLLKSRMKRNVEIIEQRLSFEEQNLIYACPKGTCPPVSFEDAFSKGFACPTCGEQVIQVDNTATKIFLRKRLQELRDGMKTT